jgi:hypothetical protein
MRSKQLIVTEGELKRFTLAELGQIRPSLTSLAQFALDALAGETDIAKQPKRVPKILT